LYVSLALFKSLQTWKTKGFHSPLPYVSYSLP
jgi:hypothetical protein